MKVLTILTTPVGKNGISSVVKNYYDYLDKKKITIDFLFPNIPSEDIRRDIEKNGSKYYIVPGRVKKIYNYSQELLNILKKGEYDVVHAHGNSHTLYIEMKLAKMAGIKTRIPHSHNTYTKFPLIHKLLSKPFYRSYTRALACGIDAGRWLYSNKPFEVLYNGIPVEEYKFNKENRVRHRKKFNINEDDILIGHVGSLSDVKNQQFLLRFINYLKRRNHHFKLMLVGEGNNRVQYEKYIKDNNLWDRVILTGNRNDVRELYSAFDLLIMPSKFEGLPVTLVESQASDLKSFVSKAVTDEANISNQLIYFDLSITFDELYNLILKELSKSPSREENIMYKKVEESSFNIRRSVDSLLKYYQGL